MSFSNKRLGDYPDYVRNLLRVKAAAARANMALGVLPDSLGNAILSAVDQASEQFDADQYPVDVCHGGGGIGINMNVNEVLASLVRDKCGLSVDPVSHVNQSQSTADVCHTAIRLTLLDRVGRVCTALGTVAQTLRDKQREFEGVRTIARTCMMDAMAFNFGDRLSGFAQVIERRALAISMLQPAFRQVNLGGTVIGSGDGTPPGYKETALRYLIELSGEPLVTAANLFDAAQNVDELVALSQSLSNAAQALLKISQDIRFLASGPEAGIGELRLPKTQAGSSFFPGKVNPVLPEMMMQCAMLVTGITHSVELCQMHGESDLNVFEEFASVLVMDQLAWLDQAASRLTVHALAGMTVDHERCQAHATTLVPLVTELANRHGYARVAAKIDEATVTGIPIREALQDMDGHRGVDQR